MVDKKFTFIILIIVCGLAAGAVGDLLVRFYFFKDLYNVPYGNEVNLTNDNLKNNLVINNAQKVVVNQDVKVDETISGATASLMGIFKKQTPSAAATGFNRSNYYDLSQPNFYGLILTSDGWLLMAMPANYNATTLVGDYVAIGADKKNYALDQVISDQADNLLFVHLANAKDLAVENLASVGDTRVGQLALVVDWQNDALLTAITSIKNRNQLVKSSDRIDEELILANEISDNFKNSFVFDLSGNLIGLVNGQKTIKSIVDYHALIMNILQTRKLGVPSLGVNYLDLSRTAKNDATGVQGNLQTTGALIYPDNSKVAVLKGSPAAAAGLAAGDIILAVNNIELDASNDLAQIVQDNSIGDKLTLRYSRQGKIQDVEVALGQRQ